MQIRAAFLASAPAATVACGYKRTADDAKRFLTGDTETISAKLDQRYIDAQVDYANRSTQFDGLALDPVTARKITVLKTSLPMATPSDHKESAELTRITSGLQISGTRQMDASAIRGYFAPLEKWLDQQNQGKPVGW